VSDREVRSFLLLLRRDRGRYRDLGVMPGADDPDRQRVMQSMLSRICREAVQDVEVKGRLYSTSVYVPNEEPDVAYVEVDQDGVPLGASGVKARWRDRWTRLHTRRLSKRWDTGDGLTPDTRVPLDSWFVPPRFVMLAHQRDVEKEKQLLPEISWERLTDHTRVVILGDPGAGKTSALRRLVLDSAMRSERRSDTIPIYIQLRDFPVADLTGEGLERLLATEGMPDLAAEFEPPLSAGRVLLLLDGLDELADEANRSQAIESVRRLCAQLANIRVILTSRQATYRWDLPNFAHLRLLPYNDAQIRQWTYQYLVNLKGRSAWSRLTEELSEDPQLTELVRNPLFLSTVTSFHCRYSTKLNDHASLLGKWVDVLLQDWDAARGISRWEASSITPRQISSTLEELSASLVETERDEFTLNDVSELLNGQVGIRERPLVFLNACHSTGLVREVDDEKYSFSHASIQEYLAAHHLVNRTSDVSGFLGNHLEEPRARRVWAMSCSIASDADNLLQSAIDIDRWDAWKKALLLTNVLAYEISAPKAVITRCSDIIATVLEEAFENDEAPAPDQARRLVDRNLPHHDATGNVVWFACLLGPSSSRDPGRDDILGSLLPQVHRARLGTAREVIEQRLRSSKVAGVRLMATAMEYDGRFTVNRFSELDRSGLIITVLGGGANDEEPEQSSTT
jgi:hypothetical protein